MGGASLQENRILKKKFISECNLLKWILTFIFIIRTKMKIIKTELLVIGAGPGGYTAAFYAAAKGKKVVLVEEEKRLGGVCLNRGCIPSKALLHIAKLIQDAKEADKCGIEFSRPRIQLTRLRDWKESILEKLGQGIANLAVRRGVEIIRGHAAFDDAVTVHVKTETDPVEIPFSHAIIATGSRASMLPIFDIKDKRLMTSTEALAVEEIPKKLLVIGGGYIGMELGTVYAALGSEVVVAEVLDNILAGVDADLVRIVRERSTKIFKEVRTQSRIQELKPRPEGIEVTMAVGNEEKREIYDRVLVSVGRIPNTQDLGLDRTRVTVNEKGFVEVDSHQKTAEAAVYAIGDASGGVLLAHKASKEAKIAVDAICGESGPQQEKRIPAIVFTDPEIAWCGLTEAEARSKNVSVQIVKFPWSASGRALTMDRAEGFTKLIIDPVTEKILGVGICGVGAGELISEGALAVSCGLKAKELENVVHPHPTLSETLMECAAMFYGHATHAFSRKRG